MWRLRSKKGDSESKAKQTALNELTSQGFPKDQAATVLAECNNDVAKARSKLEKMSEKAASCSSDNPPPYNDEPPPPYSECDGSASSSSVNNQPLYVSQEKESFLTGLDLKFPVDTDERCSSCFDPIKPDAEEGFSGKMVWHGSKAYHSECYMKYKGPKCEHCCFALISDASKGLSGKWGIYDNQKYHEECYMQYAGPRCSSCCDVIAPKPDEGFSGRWVDDSNKLYHEECFAKKNLVETRAKMS